MASCSGGTSIDQMTQIASTVMQQNFIALADQVNMVLQGCTGLWLAWEITRLATGRPIDIDKAKEQLFYFASAIVILKNPAMVWELFAINTAIGAYTASKVYQLTSPAGADAVTSLGDIACKAQWMLNDAVDGGLGQSFRELSLWAIPNFLMWILASFPLCAISWKAVRNMWSPQLRSFAIGVLIPVVIGFSCFPATRRTIMVAVRLLLSAAVQITLTAAVIGLITAMFMQLYVDSPFGRSVVSEKAGVWYGSKDYWELVLALFLAWFSFEEVLSVANSLFESITSQARGLFGGMF